MALVTGASAPNPSRRTTHARRVGNPPAVTAATCTSPATAAATGLPAGPHPVELAGLLHEVSARLLSADDLGQALERLAAFAAQAVPGALRCTVTLIGEGGPLTRASSGTAAQALDDLQYAVGEGPGLEAARTRAVITVRDVAADTRWPHLADAVRAEGGCAVVSVPIDVQRSAVGSLTLWLDDADHAGPELLITAMTIVSQAEVLLGELQRRDALTEGAIVDRAVGVLIAQRGCGVREAYDVLEETSRHLGMDRCTVAERLITAAAARRPQP
jgi:ANTAR domain